MAWDRNVGESFISGSTIYAYTEAEWFVNATTCTWNHVGGVTSPFGFSTTPTGRLYYRDDYGSWVEYASGSAYFSGGGDKKLVEYWGGSTNRGDSDRHFELDCDVSATTSTGSGTGSAVLGYTVPHLPNAPTNLTATRVSDNRIDLSWTAPTRSYEAMCLEVSVDGGAYSQCIVLWNTATSTAYTSASADHSYRFRARTYYMAAYSEYTDATAAVAMTPAAPTSITTTAAGGTSVDVTLVNPSPVATKVQYEVSTDGGTTWGATQESNSLTSFQTTVTDTGKIRVRNWNATGVSDWLVSGTITTICPPAAPTLLQPAGSVWDVANPLNISWLHNSLDGSAQTAYKLRIAKTSVIPHLVHTETVLNTDTSVSLTLAELYALFTGGVSVGDTISVLVSTKGAAGTGGTSDDGFGAFSSSKGISVYSAPTVSITSPSSTVTGMPIALEATYSDMAGFSCVYAHVSLTQGGRTLFDEDADINGSSITASLDTSEFLPTNGESYTVVLDVRSSSGLQSSANATFTTAFTEPQAGELSIMNDPDTGYAFLMATFDNHATDVDYSGWDGSADAVSISVARVNADGITPLITDGASGAGAVDKYAPLNTPYQYAVTTKSSAHAVKTVYVGNELRTPKAFFYFDSDDMASAMWQQMPKVNYSRPHQEELFFSGRTFPFLVDDEAEEESGNISFILESKEEAQAFKRLRKHSGSVVYKSTDGDVMHAKVSVGLARQIDAVSWYGQLDVSYKQVDGVDL